MDGGPKTADDQYCQADHDVAQLGKTAQKLESQRNGEEHSTQTDEIIAAHGVCLVPDSRVGERGGHAQPVPPIRWHAPVRERPSHDERREAERRKGYARCNHNVDGLLSRTPN
jgi:hypothetical protein